MWRMGTRDSLIFIAAVVVTVALTVWIGLQPTIEGGR